MFGLGHVISKFFFAPEQTESDQAQDVGQSNIPTPAALQGPEKLNLGNAIAMPLPNDAVSMPEVPGVLNALSKKGVTIADLPRYVDQSELDLTVEDNLKLLCGWVNEGSIPRDQIPKAVSYLSQVSEAIDGDDIDLHLASLQTFIEDTPYVGLTDDEVAGLPLAQLGWVQKGDDLFAVTTSEGEIEFSLATFVDDFCADNFSGIHGEFKNINPGIAQKRMGIKTSEDLDALITLLGDLGLDEAQQRVISQKDRLVGLKQAYLDHGFNRQQIDLLSLLGIVLHRFWLFNDMSREDMGNRGAIIQEVYRSFQNSSPEIKNYPLTQHKTMAQVFKNYNYTSPNTYFSLDRYRAAYGVCPYLSLMANGSVCINDQAPGGISALIPPGLHLVRDENDRRTPEAVIKELGYVGENFLASDR